MRYLITIFNTKTKTTFHLERNDKDITATIEKELGGYNNLHRALTSGVNLPFGAFCEAGSTKDGSKMFSILGYPNN